MSLPDQYPEVLVDMADCIRQRLCLSLPADQAEPLALDIIEAIRIKFSGETIHIPMTKTFDRAQRDKAVLAEFDGHNHRALARRYGLSLVRIYQIINREQKSV